MSVTTKNIAASALVVLVGLAVWWWTPPSRVQITAAEMSAGPASEAVPPATLAVAPRPAVGESPAMVAPSDPALAVETATGSVYLDVVVRDVVDESAVPDVTVTGNWYMMNPA